MNEKIINLITERIRSLNEKWGISHLETPTAVTCLFEARSQLDSLALVNLIAEIEERINDSFGRDVIIVDERAMSLTHSPFRKISSLAD